MNTLIPVEYRSKRILTTEQLAEIYETDINNIQVNFKNNKDRFIEGKHYFLLQGESLKEFKRYLNQIQIPISKFAPQLYLWTKRGASRHCKILDTDKAWEQFDHLEETYFNPRRRKSLSHPNLKKLLTAVKTKREFFLLSGLSKRSAYSRALESVEQEFNADLSEFKSPEVSGRTTDINLILEAVNAAISNGAVYRELGNGLYALNRDMVYQELDSRGLSRKISLRELSQAEILKRGNRHFTRKITVDKGHYVRAFFIAIS